MITVEQYEAGVREEGGVRFYQTMPPLSAEEFADLRNDIAANGVTVPVIVDEHGNIIDGHHRVMIARELAVDYPTRLVKGLSEAEKETMSVSLNIKRRQLTREQKRLIIASQLKSAPEKSNREHAKALGIDHKTVQSVRAHAEATGEIPQLTHTVGADGKQRPAQRPAPALDPPMVVNEVTGEVLDPMTTAATPTLRTDAEWEQIASRARAYKSLDAAHADLAPDNGREYFGQRMRDLGVTFLHPNALAKLTAKANDLVERVGDNIFSYAEGSHESLEIAELDLVDPEVASRAIAQLESAIPEIRKLIKTLKGISS